MSICKGFFHGRGRHSKGFDGYVLCGVVDSELDTFDKDTYNQFSQLQNFRVELKDEPTQEELDAIIADKVSIYKTELETPIVEEDTPEIAKLKELGLIDASVKKRSVLELDVNDKNKEKTAPMKKLESTLNVTTPYAVVDDFVENELTDEQQTSLAIETARIKGSQ